MTDSEPQNSTPQQSSERVGLLIWEAVCTIIVVFLFGMFAVRHWQFYQSSGQYTALLLTIKETLDMIVFLCRRIPLQISSSPFAWIVGFLGFLVPLLMQPHSGNPVMSFPAAFVITVGFMLQFAALGSLWRSFGIIAANRGVRTGGLYRFVRHPLYASYVVSYIGYLMENSTNLNILCVALTVLLFILRIRAEERLLSEDAAYRAYAAKVKWRLVPFLY